VAKNNISCVPAGIIGILFDDWVFANFYNSIVVSLALIIYGNIIYIY
jgi:undecaprenyl-diphosphatase